MEPQEIAQALGDQEATQPAPVNLHASITQVKNGFILYAGPDTKVAYTFDELVGHLKQYFV